MQKSSWPTALLHGGTFILACFFVFLPLIVFLIVSLFFTFARTQTSLEAQIQTDTKDESDSMMEKASEVVFAPGIKMWLF